MHKTHLSVALFLGERLHLFHRVWMEDTFDLYVVRFGHVLHSRINQNSLRRYYQCLITCNPISTAMIKPMPDIRLRRSPICWFCVFRLFVCSESVSSISSRCETV